MSTRQRHFITFVIAAGTVAFAWAVRGVRHLPGDQPRVLLVLLTLSVIVAERLPIKAALHRGHGEVTMGTAFGFAVLLTFGPAASVVSLVAGCVLADALQRRPLVRIAFNAAQYALATAAAAGVLALLTDIPIRGAVPFAPSDVPAVLVAATVFHVVNTALVATVVAMASRMPVSSYVLADLAFQAASAGLMLGFAPLIVLTGDFSPWVLPLVIVPLVAMHRGGREMARSEHQALHDALTGLPNRVLFAQQLGDAVADAARHGRRVAAMLLDLDHFKEVNDTLGHGYGDRMLQTMSARLRDCLRPSDVIARLGGDEFGVLVPAVSDHAEAERIARRLIAAVQEPIRLEDLTLHVDGSIGVACFPEHGSDAETLLRLADIAMYSAKAERTGVERYSPRLDRRTPEHLALMGELAGAIHGGEIVAFVQPIVDLRMGRVVAAEALARWRHPRLGLLSPDDFITLAEQTGLVSDLTRRMLDSALGQAAEWRARGMRLAVAVNLSARSFLDGRLIEDVEEMLARWEVEPELLTLEITESMVMGQPHRAEEVLARLRGIGVTLSVDDFGTGYSSLTYLIQLPVGQIKIDRSFTMRMAEEPRSRAVVRSLVALARDIGVRVVAEGIEHDAVRDELRALGCQLGQGYLFSRPLPPEAALEWLQANAGHSTHAGTLRAMGRVGASSC